MEKRGIIEMVVLMALLTLLILPGLMYIDILAHEAYHYLKHRDYAKEICLDVNSESLAHVTLLFPSGETIDKETLEREERKADKVGKVASVIYLVNAIIIINWIFLITVRRIAEK